MSFGANAILNVSSWFVPALVALIAVPITVRGLGADAYGLLALVTAVTGYLGLMEMGLGTAIVRYLSFYRALNQGRPMLGIIRFASTWFGAAGAIGALGLFFGAHWIATVVLHVPATLVDTAVDVLHITALGFFSGMFVSVGAAIPQAFLRYDLAAGMTAVFGVLGSAGPAVLVLLGYGLTAVVAYAAAINVTTAIIYALIARHLFRPIDITAGPEWRTIRRETLRFAGVAALNQIHSVIASQTSRVVVGAALGVAAAAYYQVPSLLSSRVSSMLSRVAYVVFPTASGMRARDDHEGVTRLYLRTSRLIFVINGSVTMAMCALSAPLLQYWVSPEYAREGAAALAIFSISNAINGSTMSASYVNLSATRPGVNLAFAFSNSAVALATIYPLTVRYGVTGAAFAGLLGATNVPVFLWYAHKHVIHTSSWLVWRTCYQPTVLGNVLAGIPIFLFVAPLLPNLLWTLATFVAAIVAGGAISGVLGAVKREDIHDMTQLIAHAFSRLTAHRRTRNIDDVGEAG